MIINHKTQKGFVPLLVLFALFAVGNVVFQLINDRSELMKFTSVTAFSVLVLVSVFVSGSVMEALPIFIAMGMCIIYMDTFHIRVTCGVSTLGILVETIIQIAKHGFALSATWIEILLLAAIFTFGSGYSSLNMLKDIKMDTIKLDMGFLRKTRNNERSCISGRNHREHGQGR